MSENTTLTLTVERVDGGYVVANDPAGAHMQVSTPDAVMGEIDARVRAWSRNDKSSVAAGPTVNPQNPTIVTEPTAEEVADPDAAHEPEPTEEPKAEASEDEGHGDLSRPDIAHARKHGKGKEWAR